MNKNKNRNRPMSPHLTIYKPQLTSMLSISTRITGMVLTGATCLFAGATAVYAGDMELTHVHIRHEGDDDRTGSFVRCQDDHCFPLCLSHLQRLEASCLGHGQGFELKRGVPWRMGCCCHELVAGQPFCPALPLNFIVKKII